MNKLRETNEVILEILENARRYNVSYRDFFYLLIKSYGYRYNGSLTLRRDVVEKILSDMNRLTEIVRKLPDTLNLLKKRVKALARSGYNPFLVDCLGFPEVYELYRQVIGKCGILSVKIEAYVNVRAMTYRFTETFHSVSMAEIARELGTSLYKSMDKMVHHEFGEPMDLKHLIGRAKARLKVYVDELVRDVVSKRKAVVVADHGYDVYCSEDYNYYLGHGRGARFAKISPLIIVVCDAWRF